MYFSILGKSCISNSALILPAWQQLAAEHWQGSLANALQRNISYVAKWGTCREVNKQKHKSWNR